MALCRRVEYYVIIAECVDRMVGKDTIADLRSGRPCGLQRWFVLVLIGTGACRLDYDAIERAGFNASSSPVADFKLAEPPGSEARAKLVRRVTSELAASTAMRATSDRLGPPATARAAPAAPGASGSSGGGGRAGGGSGSSGAGGSGGGGLGGGTLATFGEKNGTTYSGVTMDTYISEGFPTLNYLEVHLHVCLITRRHSHSLRSVEAPNHYESYGG